MEYLNFSIKNYSIEVVLLSHYILTLKQNALSTTRRMIVVKQFEHSWTLK